MGDVGHELAPQLLRLAQLGGGVVQRVGELRGLQVPRAGEVRVKVPVTELFRLAADGDDGFGDAVGEVEGQRRGQHRQQHRDKGQLQAQGLHRRGDGRQGRVDHQQHGLPLRVLHELETEHGLHDVPQVPRRRRGAAVVPLLVSRGLQRAVARLLRQGEAAEHVRDQVAGLLRFLQVVVDQVRNPDVVDDAGGRDVLAVEEIPLVVQDADAHVGPHGQLVQVAGVVLALGQGGGRLRERLGDGVFLDGDVEVVQQNDLEQPQQADHRQDKDPENAQGLPTDAHAAAPLAPRSFGFFHGLPTPQSGSPRRAWSRCSLHTAQGACAGV